MEIKEWIGQARNLFIKKEYLQIILPIEEKIVEFNGLNEKLFVRLSKKAPFIEVIDRSIPQLRVNFTKDGWESLNSGSHRLSLLLKLKDASFEGNYRLLLLIETIFQYTSVENEKKLLENC